MVVALVQRLVQRLVQGLVQGLVQPTPLILSVEIAPLSALMVVQERSPPPLLLRACWSP